MNGGHYVKKRVFFLNIKTESKTREKLKAQFLLTRLSALLASGVFANWLCFCMMARALGLTISLTIIGAVLIGREIAVSLFRCFLWKVVISLQRC